MTFADAKQRFSGRVDDYIRYRPGYPSAVLDVLRAECSLRPGHVIADIGSGTGFLSELFLKNGNRVYGIEPNEAMRRAGEEYLASYDRFSSIDGSAQATTLAGHLVQVGLRSSFFTPAEGHPNFAPMMEELKKLFDAYQQEGQVRMDYFTRVYYGKLKASA